MTNYPVAVSVQNVSKKFRLYNSPRERFVEAFHPFKRKLHREFWALRDVSFDVPKGTTLGIIGRNGSGKSTLLQIICSILKPTSGSVKVEGRVSSILELGAGFNPEFTGRSNVMLQGAVMGFPEREIRERLPAIESFADIGEFFDQPVKIYSSGMFVRLAFAAAINVDPDVLVIDEALAVGDAKFQRKCFRKFNELQASGKTIILVTHDMSAIVKHCSDAIIMDKGLVVSKGAPIHIFEKYESLLLTGSIDPGKKVDRSDEHIVADCTDEGQLMTDDALVQFIDASPEEDRCVSRPCYNSSEYRYGNRKAEIIDYFMVSRELKYPASIISGSCFDLYTKIAFRGAVQSPVLGFGIKSVEGIYIYATNSSLLEMDVKPKTNGDVCVFKLSLNFNLREGDYFLHVAIAEGVVSPQGHDEEMLDSRHDLIHMKVMKKREFTGIVDMDAVCEEISYPNICR